MQAGARVHEVPKPEVLKSIVCEIENREGDRITIPEIQEVVERNLMTFQPKIGETYISYRKARDLARRRSSSRNKDHLDSIVNIKGGNYVKENANMAGATPAGQMMKFASIGSTDYALDHALPEKFRELHESGDIHIHDLDYYASKTKTCVQYDLDSILNGGFWTDKTGYVGEPQRIQSYADLAAIVFQTEQNEFNGLTCLKFLSVVILPFRGRYPIFAIFFATILWSYLGTVDEVAVARGKLVPDGRLKVIQPWLS